MAAINFTYLQQHADPVLLSVREPHAVRRGLAVHQAVRLRVGLGDVDEAAVALARREARVEGAAPFGGKARGAGGVDLMRTDFREDINIYYYILLYNHIIILT